jgi:hypothetical protein
MPGAVEVDMPGAAEILEGLGRLAHDAIAVAVLWHAEAAIVLAVVFFGGWIPHRRPAAMALALPLVSVSTIAFTTWNGFNGAVFALGAVLLVAFGSRLPGDRVEVAPIGVAALGFASIGFGLFYPHFLDDRPSFFYLFAAPTGILPCPTLAMVIGFGLLGNGFGSRGWSITLAVMGVFYALFGLLRLHVWLDAGLLVSSVVLLTRAVPVPVPTWVDRLVPPT